MAKKLNLDAYMTDTPKTQVVHNKYTRYLQNEMSVPHTEEQHNSSDAPSKRINMAFSDKNYEIIMEETMRLGITCVYMVNTLVCAMEEEDVEKYLSSLPIRRSKDNIPRRKGYPQKRINLKFSPKAYAAAQKGAELSNQTITQYVNTVIEVYALEKHI